MAGPFSIRPIEGGQKNDPSMEGTTFKKSSKVVLRLFCTLTQFLRLLFGKIFFLQRMGLVKRNTNFLRILKSIFVKKIIFFLKI